jgi:hypothetical protein
MQAGIEGGHNRVLLRWVPAQEEIQLRRDAKKAVGRATGPDKQPPKQFSSAKATIINIVIAERKKT